MAGEGESTDDVWKSVCADLITPRSIAGAAVMGIIRHRWANLDRIEPVGSSHTTGVRD